MRSEEPALFQGRAYRKRFAPNDWLERLSVLVKSQSMKNVAYISRYGVFDKCDISIREFQPFENGIGLHSGQCPILRML